MTVVRIASTAVIVTAVAAFAQAPGPRPAALSIDSGAAMITIAIRPDRAAAFDGVLVKLKSALLRTKHPQRRAQAAGWQTFRSEETIQGNLTYVMRLDPAVPGADYEWDHIIAEEFPADAGEVTRVLADAVVTRTVLPLSPIAVPGLGERDVNESQGAPHAEPRVPVLSFDTAQAVVITVLVRPTRETEFISTLGYLGKALGASAKAARRQQARGWRVFKSPEAFGENKAYVMSLDPVVNRAEYDMIRLIQETYPAEVDALFGKYREAYAGQAVSRLTNRIEMSK
ncbi:MAG TPA: hypothetical protein VJ691_18940 [Vicinamibacterales bacterium]|nr:hypothetical protein [Vicinamibacterales bacterium]